MLGSDPFHNFDLSLSVGGPIGDLLDTALFQPLRGLIGRPSKRLRARLVEWGFRAASPTNVPADQWKLGAGLLEGVHAGSLIVDDIEDDSLLRRGEPTLHRRHGLAIALNAGNWLYFQPIEAVASWGLPPQQEVAIYRHYATALSRAHCGQALDVGLDMSVLDRKRVPEVCLASLELKTGALTALAVQLGGVLGGASSGSIQAMSDFGIRYGVALQMFDDVGNASAPADDPKRFEDLKLRRPSWLWASAARDLSASVYNEFLSVVAELPNSGPLEAFLQKSQLRQSAHASALCFARETLAQAAQLPLAEEARELVEELKVSYSCPA